MPAVAVGEEIYVLGGEMTDESSAQRGPKTYSGNVDVYTLGDRKRPR
jgi:hypothetical protein